MAFAAAPSIPFTVNLSEAVNVDTTGGTPRIAVTVDGLTRYATFTSGSGTAALVFTYTATAGDLDLDGVALSSPIDLNGGTIKDLNGNDATLTFTVPDTSNVKVNYPSLSMDFTSDADGRYTLNGNIYNDLSSFLSAAGGSFSRGSVATYYDSTGTLQTASAGTPRFGYDPATHILKGILIEESSTNLVYPTDMTTRFSTGGPGGATLTLNQSVGPDGLTSMEMFQKNSTAAGYLGYSLSGLSGSVQTATYSVYAKAGTVNYLALRIQGTYPSRADLNCNLTTGAVVTGKTNYASVSGSSTYVGNGIYRCSLTTTSDSTGINTAYLSGVNNSTDVLDSTTATAGNIYIYGPQFESKSLSTSFIPTTTTTFTRSADLLQISYVPSLPFGMYGEVDFGNQIELVPRFIGTSSDGRSPLETNTSGSRTNLWNGTVSLAGPSTTSFAGRIVKAASRHTSTGRAITSDGLTPTSDSNTIPMDWTYISPGHGQGYNTYVDGYVRNIKVYNSTSPSNTQLQLLTQ